MAKYLYFYISNSMVWIIFYHIVNSCSLILHAVVYCLFTYLCHHIMFSRDIYPGVGFICLMFILRTCVIMSSRKIIQSELQLSNVHFMKAYYLVHQRDSQVCVSAVWSMIISCNYTIMCNRKAVQYIYLSVVRATYLY